MYLKSVPAQSASHPDTHRAVSRMGAHWPAIAVLLFTSAITLWLWHGSRESLERNADRNYVAACTAATETFRDRLERYENLLTW